MPARSSSSRRATTSGTLCEFDDAVEEASAQATVPRADQAHVQSDLGNRARIRNMLSTWPMPVLPIVIPN